MSGVSGHHDATRSVAALLEAHRSVTVMVARFDAMAELIDVFGAPAWSRLVDAARPRVEAAVATVAPDDQEYRVALVHDGFVVVRAGRFDHPTCLTVADRLRRALTGRISAGGLEQTVTATVVVATAEAADRPAGESVDDVARTVLTRADAAVDGARRTGPGSTAVLDGREAGAARGRATAAAELAAALHGGEIHLEHHPVVSAVSEELAGLRAVPVWDRPVHGRMSGVDLSELAEHVRIAAEFGRWLLRQACADLRLFIDGERVPDRTSVHLRLSTAQLVSEEFVTTAIDSLRVHQIRPPQLVVNVGGAVLLAEHHEVARVVTQLRRIGVRVAVERVGIGSDPFDAVRVVGADLLRLDGTLVPMGAAADPDLVRGAVLMAHSMELVVVAEGVTDLDQLRRLRAAGCDLAEGPLFGEPFSC